MTSPVVRPAWAAGPPETTLLTVAPPLLDPLEPLPELPPKKPPVPLCPLLLPEDSPTPRKAVAPT